MGIENKTVLQLRSLIKKSGELELSLVKVAIPEPAADEVVVRVEATPINPSDIGLLLGAADVKTAKFLGTSDAPVVTATVPESAMKAMAGRLDESMPVGNEGAGVVVKAGASDAAQTLLGKTVAMIGGAMYAQYRCLKAADCLVLPAGTTPTEGARSGYARRNAGSFSAVRKQAQTAAARPQHSAIANDFLWVKR